MDLNLQISETNYTGKNNQNKVSDEWVIGLLKLYGNCCINRYYNHNLRKIEKAVGKIKKNMYEDNCYILEVVK